MRMMLSPIVLVACASDPMSTERQQDERIEVHGCDPRKLDIDGQCIDPWPDGEHGGGTWGDWNEGHGGGGGGGSVSGPVRTNDPNVYLHYRTFGGTLCRCACLVLSAAVCATIADACATATVFTFGGVTVPCAAVLRACLYGGSQAVGQFCSEYVCPD